MEVDEDYLGGEEHGEGRRGRDTGGVLTKSMVAVAVEHRSPGKPAKTGGGIDEVAVLEFERYALCGRYL